MPQMAPLLWLPLFVFFCSILLNIYCSIKTPIKISHALKATPAHKLTWKW